MGKFLLLLLVLPLRAAAPDLAFAERIVAFDKQYQTFVGDFCGWTRGDAPGVGPNGTVPCYIDRGHTEYASFAKARKAAMTLFDLTERPR